MRLSPKASPARPATVSAETSCAFSAMMTSPQVAQVAVHDLPLDLDAHQQEEHGHRRVVHPPLERQVDVEQVAELH